MLLVESIVPRLGLIAAMLATLIVLWLAGRRMRSNHALPVLGLTMILMAALWIALSTIADGGGGVGIGSYSVSLLLGIAVFVAVQLDAGNRSSALLLTAVLAVVGLISGFNLLFSERNYASPEAATWADLTGAPPSLMLENFNLVAYEALLGAGAATVLFRASNWRKYVRLLLLGSAFVCATALLVADSRATYVGLTILVVAMMLPARVVGGLHWSVWAVTWAATLALPFWVTRFEGPLLASIGGDAAGTWSNRMLIWPEMVNTLHYVPPTGMGAYAAHNISSTGVGAHNLVLTLWIDFGAPTAIFLIVGLLALVIRAYRFSGDAEMKTAAVVLTTLVIVVCSTGHFEQSTSMWLALALGAVLPISGSTVAMRPRRSGARVQGGRVAGNPVKAGD